MKRECIYINCYNNFTYHSSGRRHENQTNSPIFFIGFSSPNCLGNSFFHLKNVKIHFYEVPPFFHSGLQNTWILEVEAMRFVPFNSENIHNEESKKPGFTCPIKLRTNSKIFSVISWSKMSDLVLNTPLKRLKLSRLN